MAIINRIVGCATEYVYQDSVSKDTMVKDYTILEGSGIQGCINGEIIKIVKVSKCIISRLYKYTLSQKSHIKLD
jgi:hypothetical protein